MVEHCHYMDHGSPILSKCQNCTMNNPCQPFIVNRYHGNTCLLWNKSENTAFLRGLPMTVFYW